MPSNSANVVTRCPFWTWFSAWTRHSTRTSIIKTPFAYHLIKCPSKCCLNGYARGSDRPDAWQNLTPPFDQTWQMDGQDCAYFPNNVFVPIPGKKLKKLFVWCLYACVQQKKPFKWLFRRWMERLNWTELSQEKKGLCYKRTSEVDLVQGLSKHCSFPAPKKNEPIRLPWGIKCQPSKKGACIFKACGGMGHVTSWNIGCLTE